MKKANWLITAVIAIVSAFLLWLWYYLGFNRVDNPLDLVLTLCWWLLVVGICVGVQVLENKRRERIRTAYIGQGVLFNPEAGYVNTSGAASSIEELESILEGLKYGFDMKELPNPDTFPVDCIVRTKKFKAKDGEGNAPSWEGDVCFVGGPDKCIEFRNRSELKSALKSAKA